MQATNGVNLPGDIGGPMDIGNGYRWNVPVVTYGFDKSFLDYFGSNGVAAVESAIQVLNDLPPASQMVLTNYPTYTTRMSPLAASLNAFDLKSVTLSLLLEQMGLTRPSFCMVVIKQWTPLLDQGDSYMNSPVYQTWPYPDYLVDRNFDPFTLLPSSQINGDQYFSFINDQGSQHFAQSASLSPSGPQYFAVADRYITFNSGTYFTGLTQDDVGGLRYLLSTNNVNYEDLLPDVHGPNVLKTNIVRGARRPGIEKITFLRQPQDQSTGQFLTLIHPYTDQYFANGVLMSQAVKRVITKPDFLFVSENLTNLSAVYYDRTGTTNWINNSLVNGSSEGGPGVIVPQVKIFFGTFGHEVDTYAGRFIDNFSLPWASFDGSTNTLIVYPVSPQGVKQYSINMILEFGSGPSFTNPFFSWPVTNSVGSISLFQSSTNLTDWVTTFSTTNDGSSWYYYNVDSALDYQFYRVIPQ